MCAPNSDIAHQNNVGSCDKPLVPLVSCLCLFGQGYLFWIDKPTSPITRPLNQSRCPVPSLVQVPGQSTEPAMILDCSESPSDMSDLQADHTGTPKGKKEGD